MTEGMPDDFIMDLRLIELERKVEDLERQLDAANKRLATVEPTPYVPVDPKITPPASQSSDKEETEATPASVLSGGGRRGETD